jgi:hypothetical protein
MDGRIMLDDVVMANYKEGVFSWAKDANLYVYEEVLEKEDLFDEILSRYFEDEFGAGIYRTGEDLVNKIRSVYGSYEEEENWVKIDELWSLFVKNCMESDNPCLFGKKDYKSNLEPWVVSWALFLIQASINPSLLSAEDTPAEDTPAEDIIKDLNASFNIFFKNSLESFSEIIPNYIKNLKAVGPEIISAIRSVFICQDYIGNKRVEVEGGLKTSFNRPERLSSYIKIPREYREYFCGISYLPLFIRNLCIQKIDGEFLSQEDLYIYMEDVYNAFIYLSKFNNRGRRDHNFICNLLASPEGSKIEASLKTLSSFSVGNVDQNYIYKTWVKPYLKYLEGLSVKESSYRDSLCTICAEDSEGRILFPVKDRENKIVCGFFICPKNYDHRDYILKADSVLNVCTEGIGVCAEGIDKILKNIGL